MNDLVITPHMNMAQLAELLDQLKAATLTEVYVRIESIAGKPVGYIVREPRIPAPRHLALLKTQAE